MTGVIIPYIDCWNLTQRAVQSVIQPGVSPILLIDNGSTEDTRHSFRQWYQTLPESTRKIIFPWRHAPQFPSLAQTWNHALDFMWEIGESQALVLNNDAEIATLWMVPCLAMAMTMDPSTVRGPLPWVVTGVGVNQADWDKVDKMNPPSDWSKSRGGPDFSCFLISKACHQLYRFDPNFIPAYHEDNDYHRRLVLDGYGDKIYSLNLPFLHHGSATINRTPEVHEAWGPQFESSRAYYVRKWGGLPGEETYSAPFGEDY